MSTPRKLTLDDLWAMQELGGIALSPDGRRVAFVMNSIDRDKDEDRSAIFLLHLDEQGHALGEPRPLTSGLKKDTSPVWAPDSKRLLFLSNRDENTQLWLIDTDGGEPCKLTAMQHGVDEATWSPDGAWIAFTASMAPHDDDDVVTGRKPLDEAGRKKYKDEERIRLRTVKTVIYREDGRGTFEQYSQLFVMPAPSDTVAVEPATIRRLTDGEYDHQQPAWTPDSTEITVLCNRANDRDQSYILDLWAIKRESGEARRLTDGTLQTRCYVWSPDGRSVAVVAQYDVRVEGHCTPQLYLVSREGGTVQALTEDVDHFVGIGVAGDFGRPGSWRPQWSADGQHMYYLVSERGCINVYHLDLTTKTRKAVTSDEALVYFLALLPGEQALLITLFQKMHPWEFYRLPLVSGGEKECLTHLHDREMVEYLWSEPQRFQYKGANDEEVDGWVMLPIGAREGIRYPLMVTIHGGPQSAYGIGLMRFCQYFAAQGFAVFYCNPHGSTSYGQAFMREVEDDNCGWDYEDVMRGVDACVERGIADPERLVVTGYSYGGQMSMYIVTQTERFKAAVPRAGISNLASFVGTSDIGYLMVVESRGGYWDSTREAYYRDRSAITHVTRVTTPTLIIHPENDLRCPIEQSEQFYVALKMIGKAPVEFIRIPASWHGGTPKPSQRITHWQKIADWFNKFVEIRPEEYI